jgi:hypothetical protein
MAVSGMMEEFALRKVFEGNLDSLSVLNLAIEAKLGIGLSFLVLPYLLVSHDYWFQDYEQSHKDFR